MTEEEEQKLRDERLKQRQYENCSWEEYKRRQQEKEDGKG